MASNAFFLFVTPVFVLTLASPAEAHFKLHRPVDWLITDDQGDPTGSDGTQKMNPCGLGVPSSIHTKVRAGSKLHVRLTETVPHGGHYRIAVLPKVDLVDKDIPEPDITLDGDGECATAKVESPVTPPVVADNLFPHTQDQATSGQVWETDIPVPTQTGNATMQIIEFMTPHAPQCFYHHCAELEIVDASATDVPDQGLIVGPDGGVITLPDDSDPTTPASDPGATSGGAATSGGPVASDDGGTSGPAASGVRTNDSGCNAGGGAPSLLTLGGLLALAISILRRRR